MTFMSDEYKRGLRSLLETKGKVVDLKGGYYDPADEFYSVWESYSTYGWADYKVNEHIREKQERVKRSDWKKRPSYDQYEYRPVKGSACKLVIPEGVQVKEVSYSEFENTFTSNNDVVGVNAWGGPKDEATAIHCGCGKYEGLMVRWEGSLMEALQVILGVNGEEGLRL